MLRAEKQWTQEYVAFEAGMSKVYLSDLERARRNPSIVVLEKLAADSYTLSLLTRQDGRCPLAPWRTRAVG